MQYLFCFIAFISLIFACNGDCASCHFKLNYHQDKRHTPMLECKNCHTPEKMGKINMGDTCGADCFACHDISKFQRKELMQDHKVVLESCISCHKKLLKNPLNKDIFLQKDLMENFFLKNHFQQK